MIRSLNQMNNMLCYEWLGIMSVTFLELLVPVAFVHLNTKGPMYFTVKVINPARSFVPASGLGLLLCYSQQSYLLTRNGMGH